MVFGANRPARRRRVPGYGGRYMVDDLGRVFSGGRELSLIGGRYVKLCGGGEAVRTDVAYLVARAFLPNAEGRPWVVHRDGNRENNRVENLEWSERREVRGGGRPARDARAVLQYTADGVCVARYASVAEASRVSGVARNLIVRCADGGRGRTKGYKFRYD